MQMSVGQFWRWVNAVVVVGGFTTFNFQAFAAEAKSVTAIPKISLYQGGRIAVVTPTYDDTLPSQIKRLVPLFKEFGYRCTFYINSSRVGPKRPTRWDQWKSIALDGFEVGNHGRRHYLKVSDPEWTKAQIYGGYDDIEKHTGVAPLTFAFPGGSKNPLTLDIFNNSKHIDYRKNSHIKKSDRLWVGERKQVKGKMPGFIDRVLNHEKTWNKSILSWMITVMHDITDEKEAAIREMLEYIKKHEEKIWCTTYANATLYEKEREKSKLAVTQSSSNKLVFTLTNDLDPTIFKYPLTVEIPVPKHVKQAKAFQGKKQLSVDIKSGLIYVDCVPMSESVTVSW